MNLEMVKYCHAHRLSTYELYCKAYADFLNRPLVSREYGRMHEQSQEYLAHQDTEPPHFVKFFLIKERRKVRHTQISTSGM